VESWVALAAYPWNWAPIVDHERDEHAGYYFGIGPLGEVGLELSHGGHWLSCRTESKLKLRKFTHVAAVFDPDAGITVFVDGSVARRCERRALQPSADLGSAGGASGGGVLAAGVDLLIGMNHEKRVPSHPVRPQATLAAWFTIDGILDEVKIHTRARSAEELRVDVRGREASGRTRDSSPGDAFGPQGSGPLRRLLHASQLLQGVGRPLPGQRTPGRRGPVRRLAASRGLLAGHALLPGLGHGERNLDGRSERRALHEPRRLLRAHARPAEPLLARPHHREPRGPDRRALALRAVSVRQEFSQPDERTGWSDWIDEYFTFFPDGLAVREVVMFTSGKPLGPSEFIVLAQPGQRPEDIINLDALTLVNLKGESHLYSWRNEMPDFSKEEKPASSR
jgi:hypothetical protein